jgi:hypothetical protein
MKKKEKEEEEPGEKGVFMQSLKGGGKFPGAGTSADWPLSEVT